MYGLNSLYHANKLSTYNRILGKIIIDKINLEYIIFNEFDENLLKIAPCRFYGPNSIEKDGNICIAGHNYNDNRFFGRIAELKVGDKINIVSDDKNLEYIVYKVFETDENDISILNKNKNREITLLTCNNANKKRIIIKAFNKEK